MLFEQINRKKVVITKCGQLPHENSIVLVDCQLCSSFLLTYQNLSTLNMPKFSMGLFQNGKDNDI